MRSKSGLKTVVWFKRDLRVRDHAPLAAGASEGSVLPLYIHEPLLFAADDFASQHAGFNSECLDSVHQELLARGAPLVQMSGAAVDSLEAIWQLIEFDMLRSHQETGNGLSYERDREVAAWCRRRGVRWIETPQNGVIRGSVAYRASKDWSAELEEYTGSEPVKAPVTIVAIEDAKRILSSLPPRVRGDDPADVKAGRMRGGRSEAIRLLGNFFKSKILAYPGAVSSPLTAEHGCSRLSPYLTFGVVSVREVILTMNRRLQLPDVTSSDLERERMIKAMRFFVDRIRWRSGYFQIMEAMPQLEFENINRAMNGLRESEFNRTFFDAWKRGETGYPMIDACMNMLLHTGWINMRMRGMLISFAVNELWLHWREPGLFLARQFLDYEPAIHYNQLQIHAGTAGGAQLLSYNPVKQAQDLDPKGKFVRRWIPALAKVPDEFLFEPWRMPQAMQTRHGLEIGRDYPAPIVDHVSAGRLARERVSAAQKQISASGSGSVRQIDLF